MPFKVIKLKQCVEDFKLNLSKFDQIQLSIELGNYAEDSEAIQMEFENQYFFLTLSFFLLFSQVEELTDFRTVLRDSPSVSLKSVYGQIKLPRIDLIHFNGSYEKLLSFYNTLNSLIYTTVFFRRYRSFII